MLVGVLFTSPLQTWFAQTFLLDRQPGWKSSVGEVWAGFGQLKVTDLRVEADGAVLSLPSLQARLPLSTAAWDHRFVVRSLVAKGWTLDLSGVPAFREEQAAAVPSPAGGPPVGTPAQTPAADTAVKQVADIFRGILGGWKSPYDLQVDGVDLEGEVLVSLSRESAPVKIHVRLNGGGLSAGREGNFTLEAEAEDPWPDVNSVAAHGQLTAGMSSPRALNRVEIKFDLAAQGRRFPGGFTGSADLAATPGPDGTALTFDLMRDQRHLVAVQARTSAANRRVAGKWRIDWRDTDVATLAPQLHLPAFAGTGEGDFDADNAFAQVHVLGRLDAVVNHLEVLAPALEQVGTVTVATRFDVTARDRVLRVEALEVSLAGVRPVAAVRALQSFDFNADTHDLQPANPAGEWLEASVQGLPLNWLSGLTGKFVITGADATGEFFVRASKGGFSLSPKTPLVVKGVSVQRAGRPLARDLDLSLPLSVESTPEGWQMMGDPLAVTRAGQLLARITIKAARTGGADQPVTLKVTWAAPLDAMAGQPALAGFTGSSSGEFNATLDNGFEVDGKLDVRGHDLTHSLTASFHGESVGENSIEFKVPFTLNIGKSASAFSAEGRWTGDAAGVLLNGRLTGEEVDLDHVRLLAAPLAAALGLPRSQSAGVETRGSAEPDRKPFWLGWSGEVTVAFDRLRSGGKVFNNVGATFDVDESSIHLARGWFGPSTENPAQAEGALTFDGTAEFPYHLKASATVSDIDVVPLLGVLPKKNGHQVEYKYGDEHEQEPVLEGHFSIAATVTGTGRNLNELVRNVQEKYEVTAKGGIIRLLKTSVSDALPNEPPTPVSDAAGTVASWVGWVAGINKDSIVSSEKPVSKNTEAVLNLTSQVAEIGFDQLSVTATRGHDQVIRLVAIEMIARDERLTGSGQITGGNGQPLATRPLTMDLKLGVRGNVAALLSQTGLLTTRNDELGYLQLARPAPLHFAGTLQNPDVTDWHDLLAKAAMPPAKPGKK